MHSSACIRPLLELTLSSLVVLQSLRQSRSIWVTTLFPKFSVKTRGGRPTEVIPPPHTTKAYGKYDLLIGPHVFADTAIYEVHYLPPNDITASQTSAIQSANLSSVQTSLSSVPFPSGTYVTPAMSSKVLSVAKEDQTLANLLNAVVKRTATDDQVRTLGYLIQSMGGVQTLDQSSAAPGTTLQPPVRPVSPKPFDIVLEFHERPSERFVLSRGDVVCDLVASKSNNAYRASDVIVTCCIPFPRAATFEPSQTSPEARSPEVATFRISRISQSLWDLLFVWAGGLDRIEESRVKLSQLAKVAPPRSYLQHRLPEGDLLEDIQNSVAPAYTMKPVKPPGADSNRPKRKSVSRRPTVVSGAPSTPLDISPPAKRRNQPKPKVSAPPPIACHSCGQTDVPLMMGGRYCRECINAGKAVADIPQVQPSRMDRRVPAPHTLHPNAIIAQANPPAAPHLIAPAASTSGLQSLPHHSPHPY
ncbi:hypothetical protein C8Q79DRAFT_935720 [Trametes meyenii]|nr:hypothetical protein C8Q79DRAFT_935720 [Trametes meyenii]